MTRKEQYAAMRQVWPDETAGLTDLEAEAGIRAEVDGYCTRKELAKCQDCSLVNYGRDCHNNRIG